MARETQKEKIERLERENAQLEQRIAAYHKAWAEAERQKNAAVRETDEYKALEKALAAEQVKVKVAMHSCELDDKMNRQLRNANAELKEKYDTLAAAYDALKSDFDRLNEQLKAKEAEKPRNPRGAGRKAALSEELCAKAARMHELGLSYREIGEELGVSFPVIARACQKATQKNSVPELTVSKLN